MVHEAIPNQGRGAIEQGIANKAQVVHVLKKEVKDFLDAKYEAGDVREFCLLANQKHRVCTSSPDAVFALMKKIFLCFCLAFALKQVRYYGMNKAVQRNSSLM